MDEKSERQKFLQEIELAVEQEYNAPGKPELVENTDRKVIAEKLQKLINDFSAKTNTSKKENINYLLDKLNEKRRVSPSAKEEFDVIEEVLYGILEELEENEKGTQEL